MSNFVTIEGELERNSNLKIEDIEAIKNWMAKEPHLPKISDLDIALFLNSCYFKLESTKTCIETYYTLRTHCPDFFSKRDPKGGATQKALNTVVTFDLPKTERRDFMVVLLKLKDTNPENFHLNDAIKRIDLMVSLVGPRRGLQNGHILVFDSEGLQLGHIFKLNLISLKKYLYFLQEAMPIRLKEVHVINVTNLSEKFLNIAKPFLNKEIANVIHMHKNTEGLSKHLPIHIFPKDYGGEEDSVHNLHWESVRQIEENSDFFIRDEQLKADESKRIGKRKNYDNVFGVEGSFKKLELD